MPDTRGGPDPVMATAWVAARLAAPTDALEVRTTEVGVPGPGQARVTTEAISLDFNDIDTIRGRYALLPFAPPFVPGMAVAGVVDAAGPGAEALLGRRTGRLRIGGAARCRHRPDRAQLAQSDGQCGHVLPLSAGMAGVV